MFCVKQGGHLVSIHDSEENAFVYSKYTCYKEEYHTATAKRVNSPTCLFVLHSAGCLSCTLPAVCLSNFGTLAVVTN